MFFNGPLGIVARLIGAGGGFAGDPNAEVGFAFQRNNGTYKPNNGAPLTWANLIVPIAMGGFEEYTYSVVEDDPTYTLVLKTAAATNPSANCRILFGSVEKTLT